MEQTTKSKTAPAGQEEIDAIAERVQANEMLVPGEGKDLLEIIDAQQVQAAHDACEIAELKAANEKLVKFQQALYGTGVFPMCAAAPSSGDEVMEYDMYDGLARQSYTIVVHRMGTLSCESVLYTKLEQERQRSADFAAAMQLFCDRVDRGEIKSTKTYNSFKRLLAMHE